MSEWTTVTRKQRKPKKKYVSRGDRILRPAVVDPLFHATTNRVEDDATFKIGDIVNLCLPEFHMQYPVIRQAEIVNVVQDGVFYGVKTLGMLAEREYDSVHVSRLKRIKIPKLTKKDVEFYEKHGYLYRTSCSPGFRRVKPSDFKLFDNEKDRILACPSFMRRINTCFHSQFCICHYTNAEEISKFIKREVYRCGRCECCLGGLDELDNPCLDNSQTSYLEVRLRGRGMQRIEDEEGFEYGHRSDKNYCRAYLPNVFKR